MSGPCARYPLTLRRVNPHLSDQQNSCRLAANRLLCIAEAQRTDQHATCSRLIHRRQNCWPHITFPSNLRIVVNIDQRHSSKHANPNRGTGGLACDRASQTAIASHSLSRSLLNWIRWPNRATAPRTSQNRIVANRSSPSRNSDWWSPSRRAST
jgi:hypothetical protein